MSAGTVEQRVLETVARSLEIPVQSVTPQCVLDADLSCDTLDLIELGADLEDEFSVTLPDGLFEDVRTVSDLAAEVAKHVPAGADAARAGALLFNVRNVPV